VAAKSLVAKRLSKDGPPPTLEEIKGFRQLVEDDLWHLALSRAAGLGHTQLLTPRPPMESALMM